MAEEENLKKVTGDQTWCYTEDPVTKRHHGWGTRGGIHHDPKYTVPKISCEDGDYHLCKPLIFD